jgi:hypothetical protein
VTIGSVGLLGSAALLLVGLERNLQFVPVD